MLKADLHMHSTVSDGSDTLAALAAQARENGVDVIAVTDHDTLSHSRQMPADPPVRMLAGIEISAVDPATGIKAHVLGYRIRDPEPVEALTAPTLRRRHENCLRQIGILQDMGFRIDAGDLARADGKYIYKQHIMDYLVRTGQAEERFGTFYRTVFKNGGPCDFDIRYVDVRDAVRTVAAAGGLPALAHPGQQQNFYLVPELVPLGLRGLELSHPANGAADREKIRTLAASFGLFLTGGTDYHGLFEKVPRRIGDFLSEESGIEAVCG